MTGGPPLTDAERKRLNTAIARALLFSNVTVYLSTDDHDRPVFVATRWALTKTFDSLDDLESWLDMVDGGRAEVPA